MGSEVTMQDTFVSAARAQKVAVPGDGTDTAIVAVEGLNNFALHCVPYLESP
jgi:hypothetical protein